MKLFGMSLSVGECWNASLIESIKSDEQHVHGACPRVTLGWGLLRLNRDTWASMGGGGWGCCMYHWLMNLTSFFADRGGEPFKES